MVVSSAKHVGKSLQKSQSFNLQMSNHMLYSITNVSFFSTVNVHTFLGLPF